MNEVERIVENANKLNAHIDSVVFEKDGNIIEWGRTETLHELRSSAKLLVSMAYGIAIAKKMKCKDNKILTLDTKVYNTFKDLTKKLPPYVKNWTIRTLLTHSTGYEKMMMKASQIENIDKDKLLDYIFETSTKYTVGEHFTYNNVEPYLLSVFFSENFKMDISDFVKKEIFSPLEIKKYTWKKYGKYCAGATGLYLNYKDFHKLGELILHYGMFNKKQVVPKDWIVEMTSPQIDCPDSYKPERVLPKIAAGYFVWISRDGIVFRDGAGGQYIICDRKNDMLITLMSSEEHINLVTESLRGLI